MGERSRQAVVIRLAVVLLVLAVVGAFVSQLGEDVRLPTPAAPAVLIWIPIALAWTWLLLRERGSADRLWRLPSSLFRWSLAAGAAVVVAVHVPSLGDALPRADRGLLVTILDAALYELGTVALASLAAFAVSRSLLRPVLIGTRPPLDARDLTIRTRFVVATTGAAFATAGTLLSILVDFQSTPDAALIPFLATGLALVVFAGLIGWLVGDDAASAIEAVTRRVRELATAPSRSEVPVVAADEVGDLALAEHELELRIRRDESEAASRAERERVARELHDGVAKSVSVLALEAASLAAHADDATRASLARLEHLARDLAEELRAIVRDMRTEAEREPFERSLKRIAAEHPEAAVETAGDLERIDALSRFETLRILDEALRNAERHAQARQVRARLAVDDGYLRLVVEDDGKGIADLRWDELSQHGHFGLVGMRERAALLDGDLRVERGIRGGTRVVLEVPLAKEST